MAKWIQYTLCFEEETFRGQDIVEMIQAGIGFSPKRIYAYNAFRLDKAYEAKDLETLAWEGYGVDVSLWGSSDTKMQDNLNYFKIQERGKESEQKAQILTWILPSETHTESSVIKQLLAHPCLRTAYCCDEEDRWFQNANTPSKYQMRGRNYVNAQIYFDDQWFMEMIDISHNPGRSTFVNGYELSSCWRMWFGPSFYELVSQDRLLAFPQARRVEQTDTGHVFIELYADPFEADLPENREVQQAFRDWVGMEELITPHD